MVHRLLVLPRRKNSALREQERAGLELLSVWLPDSGVCSPWVWWDRILRMEPPAPDPFFWVATSSLQAACTVRACVSFQNTVLFMWSWQGTGSSKCGEGGSLPAFGVLAAQLLDTPLGRAGGFKGYEMGCLRTMRRDAANTSPQI